MRQKKLLSLVVAAAVFGAAGAATASDKDDPVSQAVEYRQALMGVVGWNFKAMGGMVKGKLPYDRDAFANHARDLDAVARLNVLAGFPDNSDDHPDSEAKPDIWLNWEDFRTKLEDMREQTSRLAELAEGGDMAAIQAAFKEVGKTCKGCHKEYKE